jgi:hypothetical protein
VTASAKAGFVRVFDARRRKNDQRQQRDAGVLKQALSKLEMILPFRFNHETDPPPAAPEIVTTCETDFNESGICTPECLILRRLG